MSINHDPRRVQSTPVWHSALHHGVVVSFRFPVAAKARTEALSERPCLVLDIVERGGQPYALLAYGTSEKTHTGRGYETHVSRRRELRIAGLDAPTRLVGANRILVPFGHPDFGVGENGTPILGKLTGSAEERMNAVRARIIAEQDIASARRSAKRRDARANRISSAPAEPVRLSTGDQQCPAEAQQTPR